MVLGVARLVVKDLAARNWEWVQGELQLILLRGMDLEAPRYCADGVSAFPIGREALSVHGSP